MTDRVVTRVMFAMVLLLAVHLCVVGQTGEKPQSADMDAPDGSATSRIFTEEHPLVYEDAWDLWPYVFLDDNGQPTGFNVDLVSMIMDELNIPYEIRLKPTQQALEDLQSGQSDLMLGMMADFHDDYTQHYGKNVIHMFTHSVAHPTDYLKADDGTDGGLIVHRFEDLATHQVIVHTGSFSHHLMQDNGWTLNLQAFDDMALALQMVSTENNGQVLWNTMSLKWLIYKYHASNLTLSPVDMSSGEYRFMCNDSLLLARIDDAYARLKANERLQPLEMKWFYPEVYAGRSNPAWLWYVAYALAAIALMLAYATLLYKIRERRATADGRLRINRLAMVLKICQVNIWTYDVEKNVVNWYGDDARSQLTMSPIVFARRYRPGELEQLKSAIKRLKAGETDDETLQMHISELNNADNENHICNVRLSKVPLSSKAEGKGDTSDKDTKGVLIMCTENDNTEETKKLRSAAELRQRYLALFNTAMVDMIYCTSDGVVREMNERSKRTFKKALEKSENGKLTIRDFFPDGDIFSYHHITHFLTPDGEPIPPGQRRNASSRCYEMQVQPVFDKVRNPLGIFVTAREVTEIANTYVEAKKSLEKLRSAMDELSKYVDNINYVLQVGGVRIVTYSPETHVFTIFHRMHEVQYALTQQRCLALTSSESLPQVMRIMRAMDRRTIAPVSGDIRTRLRVNGSQDVCLLLQLFPIIDEQGKVAAYEGVCRDVSEIKHTEQLLKQESEKAQEVEQLKTKFLHNMCSAIRKPLDTVVQSAEMLEKATDTDDEQARIDTIKENTAYLLNLVNDILFLSRLDAHMVESNKRETDFAKTIEALCQNVWLEGRKEGVSYMVENLYDELVISIDITNLEHILEQLLQNAVGHTNSGKVRVHYEYIGGRLAVGIVDTGDGIPQEVLDHVFDRFNTPSGKDKSTGLGLPICKELATLMGGSISITSEVGKGTTVWVTLPCEAKSVVRK